MKADLILNEFGVIHSVDLLFRKVNYQALVKIDKLNRRSYSIHVRTKLFFDE